MYNYLQMKGRRIMEYFEIVDVLAREVMTASGSPTVEVEVTLDDGTVGRASVPADMKHAAEPGIAVENVNIELAEALTAMNALEQPALDRLMLEIDGTADASRLGSNAVMACSIACAKAAAISAGLSLYGYIGGINAKRIPELEEEPDGALCLTGFATLTQYLDAVDGLRRRGAQVILRAGEDESLDSVIADVAVAVNADALFTSCTAVCNELMRIQGALEE